jgi:hypothetical protein
LSKNNADIKDLGLCGSEELARQILLFKSKYNYFPTMGLWGVKGSKWEVMSFKLPILPEKLKKHPLRS